MANKRHQWNLILKEVGKDYISSIRLQEKYEVLRAKYLKAGGTTDGKMPTIDAMEIATEMQELEEKMSELWRPHQHLIGYCKKCEGIRVAGLMPQGLGFGCSKCHAFEVYLPQTA